VLINASVQQLTANDYTSHLQDATTVNLNHQAILLAII